jgi:hypothetical protein
MQRSPKAQTTLESGGRSDAVAREQAIATDEAFEDAISNELLDDVVSQLNRVCRASSLEFALRVGAIIIYHFYKGDTDAWRTRGPKLNSFRRLAEHPELPMSAAALYRCVAVFELCDRLNAPSRWRRLGASHLRVVLGVPHERQEKLLSAANEERWSVQALEHRARQFKQQRHQGGRRVQSPLARNLRLLDQCLMDCEAVLDRLDIRACEPEELERGLQLLRKMKVSVDGLAHALEDKRTAGNPEFMPSLPSATGV